MLLLQTTGQNSGRSFKLKNFNRVFEHKKSLFLFHKRIQNRTFSCFLHQRVAAASSVFFLLFEIVVITFENVLTSLVPA